MTFERNDRDKLETGSWREREGPETQICVLWLLSQGYNPKEGEWGEEDILPACAAGRRKLVAGERYRDLEIEMTNSACVLENIFPKWEAEYECPNIHSMQLIPAPQQSLGERATILENVVLGGLRVGVE